MKLVIEFGDVETDDREGFAHHIEMVADALHNDPNVSDVSIGADMGTRRVQFEVSAWGDTRKEAAQAAVAAIVEAIRAGGGKIVDPMLDPASEPFEDPLTDPFPDVGIPQETTGWHQSRIELADA